MAEKIIIPVEVQTGSSTQDVDKLNKSLKETGDIGSNAQKSSQGLSDKLAGIKGPVGQAIQGVKGLGSAFKALMANPIVLLISAIVGALTLLYKAFTSTKEGGEQMEQMMDGVSAVMDVLRDRVLKVGGAIVKFFKGEFSGAVNDLKGAFKGLGDEIEKEFQAAANLRKELQNIDDTERNLNMRRAEQNKLLAEARLRLEDENLSYADRLKALEQVRKSEIALAKDEETLAKRKYDAIVAQNALSDSGKEALDKEAAAYVALQQAQQNTFTVQKKLAKQKESLLKEEKSKSDAAKKEAEAQKKEQEDKAKEELKKQEEEAKAKLEADKKFRDDALRNEEAFVNKQYDLQKLQALREIENQEELAKKLEEIEAQRYANLLQARKDAGEDTTQMEIKFAEDLARKKGEIEKQSLESKKKLDEEQKKHQEDLYNAIGQGLGALSNLVGENSAQGKAIAIAQAIIDTYTGATKAFAQGGTFGYIGAAAVIASGLANVKKIASVKIPGAKNESTNTDMSAPSGPNVSIISGQMNSSAQLLGSLNNSLSTPPRAYVVGQDVNSQQSLDRHIRQNATL
jgi:chemotaxis protein histidine kinase CheA